MQFGLAVCLRQKFSRFSLYYYPQIFNSLAFFRNETDKVKRLQKIRGYIIGPFFLSAKLQSFAVLMVHSLSGGYMLPQIVFLTTMMYQAARSATTLYLPLTVLTSMETKVTISRIEVSTV